MSDLVAKVAFLNAQLDEDEAEARETADSDADFWADEAGSETHFDRWNPARVLREVESKRELIKLAFNIAANIDGEWGDGHTAEQIAAGLCQCGSDAAEEILTPLTAVYADHPDYDPDWRS